MGTVHLAHGHNNLYARARANQVDLSKRVLLDAELLARPICNNGCPMTSETPKVMRAALQALMDLRGFDAAVSYGVCELRGVPHIALPHRVWGEITLGSPENVIAAFTHDTRRDNSPFFVQLQWLEGEYPAGELSGEGYADFCEEWSSSLRWKKLFLDRIRREMLILRSKADALYWEAQQTARRVGDINVALCTQ